MRAGRRMGGRGGAQSVSACTPRCVLGARPCGAPPSCAGRTPRCPPGVLDESPSGAPPGALGSQPPVQLQRSCLAALSCVLPPLEC